MKINWLNKVKWDEQGLVPVIVQEAATGEVLMFAWMNREALERTAKGGGEAIYWSRSRRKLWHKGEESGRFQKVREIRMDCDGDAILLKVEQTGGIACHTGRHSCFFQQFSDGRWQDVEPDIETPSNVLEQEQSDATELPKETRVRKARKAGSVVG